MIITNLDYGEPITQEVISGGAIDEKRGVLMSELRSPDGSAIVASGNSLFGSLAQGLTGAIVEAFGFTETSVVNGGFASISGSSTSASATSEL